ncbi:MAG: pilus assembly protein TadB [Lachnospiraceae bacterium]|nr:pilus assembly protein TadB [Lachnospiraceae bacterium]
MNYERYYYSAPEVLRILGEYLLIDLLAAFLFFDSPLLFLIALIGVIPYGKYRKTAFRKKRRQALKEQFLTWITVLSGKVNGGMSAENAMEDSAGDMERLYGKNSMIVTELRLMSVRQAHSETLERCLADLGKRSMIPEIYEFAQIFSIARQNSGRMNAVITDTVRMMQEKSDTEAEIEVLISGKKLEQKIMFVIPLLILFYLRIETADFLSVLYHNPLGISVMTGCLLIYAVSYIMGERIVNITV